MTPTQKNIHRVRAYFKASGLSKAGLAKEAGIRDTVLRHIDDEAWNPTVRTLERLERVVPAEFEADQSSAA